VDVLGFDFEMGLVPQAQNEASKKGVHLALKYIPKEVFDREAVRKGHVKFYDAGYLDAALKVLPENKVTITLKGYSIFYQQDADPETLSSLKTGASKVIVENGKVVRVSKDAKGEISKEILTKQWTDWVDYWAVDFNYESRKEIIRVVERNTLQDSHPSPLPEGDKGNTENGIEVEKWTGGYIFENEWQSFRTRKDRTLELTSAPHQYPKKGKYKIAVKVIDLFGNDTTKVLEVKI
ncbi:MAG TPA: site-specific DNA-methyltransferase, partial [bacterium]|nr:site-specific DNA-methyltransferase [bacterium]